MWVTGTLTYVNSSWGYPSDSLTGETHRIYFSAEAERCLLRKPSLSNASQNTVKAYLDNGMECSIVFGGRLGVNQEHYNGQYNREATAYYDVTVNEMATNALYRPQRNDFYIKVILCALVIFGVVCVFKAVRP